MVLLQGPGRRRFLMGEVPLYNIAGLRYDRLLTRVAGVVARMKCHEWYQNLAVILPG